MSEKLYALLLRLYPTHFRKVYGEEARQLFRDRLRDEPGAFGRLRLWVDVLADLAASAPREHHRATAPAPVPAEAHLFQVLEMEPPRPATFFFGSALALASVAAFILLLSYAGDRRPLRGQSGASQFARAQSAASGSSTELSAGGEAQPANSEGNEAQPSAKSPDAAFLLDAAERRRVIAAAVQDLRQYEEDRAAARQMVAALLSSERRGRYDRITSGRTFADMLNAQMLSASRTTRVLIFYTNIPFTAINPSSTTHRIDDHFAISIPIGSSRGRISGAMKRGARLG